MAFPGLKRHDHAGLARGISLRRVSRPRALAIAAALVGVEALAGAGAGVGFLVAVVVGKPADRGVAATLAALLLVFGAGLAADARGLWRARPAAQTPAYLAQFFALVIGWYQRHTLPAVTAVVVVLAVAVVAALSAPESRDALRRTE
jgi:carbon starvation protein CstA